MNSEISSSHQHNLTQSAFQGPPRLPPSRDRTGSSPPRTSTPPLNSPLFAPNDSDTTTTPPLSRSDSKMTPYSSYHKSSLEMSPLTPTSSPQNGFSSPRWQLPASPPSPLTMVHGQSIATVMSNSVHHLPEYGTKDRPRPIVPFQRPPRKSSLCGMMNPYDSAFSTAHSPPLPSHIRHFNRPNPRDPDAFLIRPPFGALGYSHDALSSSFPPQNDRTSSLFSKVFSIFDHSRPFEGDDSMTVEDAIKMYEDGFYDSSDSSVPSSNGSPPLPSKTVSPPVLPPALGLREKRSSELRKIRSADSLRPVRRQAVAPTAITAPAPTHTSPHPSSTPTNVLRKSKSSALLRPNPLTSERFSSELFINDHLRTPSHSPSGGLFRKNVFPAHPLRSAATPTCTSPERQDFLTSNVSFSSTASPQSPRDRYGFCKESNHITKEDYDKWDVDYSAFLSRRRRKWQALMRSHGLRTDNPTVFPPKSERVKRYIRKGIPPEWRGNAWFWYSGGPERLSKMAGYYDRLVAECAHLDQTEPPSPEEANTPSEDRHLTYIVDCEHIERDLHRTFPDNILFKPDGPNSDGPTSTPKKPSPSPGTSGSSAATDGTPPSPDSMNNSDRVETPLLQSLRRVLRAFALHKSSIGYCQSLNFLAGFLLIFLNGNEEKAFLMLDIITTDHLPGTHARELEANVDVGVLMDLVRQELPTVWSKIDDSIPGLTPSTTRAESIKSVSTVSRLRRRVTPSSAVPSLQRLQNKLGGSHGGTILDQASNTLPTVSLATTSWFMSLFIGSLPVEPVARIWDSFFYEGAKVLFRASLAIFRVCEPKIRALDDRMEVFQLLQTIPRSFLDANQLMDACWRRRGGFGRVSREVVEDRRQQRRHVVRGENEARRDAESSTAPSRNPSPPPSPPAKVGAATNVGLPSTPLLPSRATTVSSPSLGSLHGRTAEGFRRQATFS